MTPIHLLGTEGRHAEHLSRYSRRLSRWLDGLVTPWQRKLGGFGAVMSEVGLWRGRSRLTLYIATMLIIRLLTPPYAPHICSAKVPMMPGVQGLVFTVGHFSNVAGNVNRGGRNRGDQASQLVSSAGVAGKPRKQPSWKMRVVLLPRAPESDSIMLGEPGRLVNRGASTHICL